MDDLSRKFRSLDWKSLQKSARRMQQSTASALKDLVMTDLENKTRSSTADTPWGASTTDLQAIAQGTYNRDDYALIMSIVWQRLASTRWRCVYKALEVLKHLIMHGSSRCAEESRGALGHLETLRAYRKMEGGRDVGEGVRTRAEAVVEMLRDEEVLQREREKSEELRRKMIGGGEGVYSGGRYDMGGAYDGEYGRRYDEEAVSRVGTSGFKGYGDEDVTNPGLFKGYDDDAGGLKGYGDGDGDGHAAKKKAAVDDLLGDSVDDNEDDDEFDPRKTTGGDDKHAGGDEDLFSTLSQADATPNHAAQDRVGNAGGAGNAESTSALVARLAAEKGALVVHGAPTASSPGVARANVGSNNTGSIWDDPPTDTNATNGRKEAGSGIWADTPVQPHPQPHPQSQNHPRVTKKDDDPFSDLLVTAKKTYT